jgi:serine-threonine kinase receptor-associated protein
MVEENSKPAQQQGRQIPVVCPGHTRPLAELQFLYVPEEKRTLLMSACHGAFVCFGLFFFVLVRKAIVDYLLYTDTHTYTHLTRYKDRKPMVRDGTTGDWIGTFVGHKGAVWSCRLDATGSLAATASGDFCVQVWDAITGKSIYQFPHKHIVKSCDFSPNSKWLATGGHEGILRVYDIQHPKAAPLEIEVARDSSTISNNTAKDKAVIICKCCWLTNSVLLTGCGDGSIRFWEVNPPDKDGSWTTPPPSAPIHTFHTDSGAEIRDMEITNTTNTDNTLQQQQQQILTVATGTHVYFYDLQTRSLMYAYKMPIHFKDEGGASLHPSGTKFVAGGSDLWVRVFDLATGTQLECLKGHHGPIRCLRYSPDGHTYASGSEDGTIRLWKTNPEQE